MGRGGRVFGATCCLLVWAVNIFPRLVSLDKQKMFSLLLRKLQMFCQHIFLNHLQLHFNHHHRLHFLPFVLSSALSSVTVAAAILTNLSNLASQASLLRPLLFQLCLALPLLCPSSVPAQLWSALPASPLSLYLLLSLQSSHAYETCRLFRQ